MSLKTKLAKYFLLPIAATAMGWGVLNALTDAEPNRLSNHPFMKQLQEQLEAYSDKILAEKTYVQFDKLFYKPGETIWFAAYVRDARDLRAAGSRVVYVELINPKGTVEKTLTLVAQYGQAAGEFELGEEVKGGMYKVRAYTKWQKNTETIFERDVMVQEVVLPNLNMKLDFERKGYGEGQEVVAFVDLANLDNTVLANHEFEYVIYLGGEKTDVKRGKTNAEGRAFIRYVLPNRLISNDGLLNVMLKYKGQTESISRSIPIRLGDVDLQFFAEGGELAAGENGIVAFKALDEFGKPIDVEGEILDKRGKLVTTFKTYHQGMGVIDFVPNADEIYVAKIKSPVALKTKYALPIAKQEAFGLRVVDQSQRNIQVEFVSPRAGEVYLVAQNGGKMVYSEAIEAKAGKNSASIPSANFQVGITQITLFDDDRTPRAERLVFSNPHKQLKINIKTDQERYLPREKVKMTVEVKDENGQPVQGDFSLAVVDDKLLTFADDRQGHVLSAMLLESDLKGEIEEPNFYFDDETDASRPKPEISRRRAMDYLLLTQGWRRFTWQQVQDNKFTPNNPMERGLLKGAVHDIHNKPMANIQILATHPKLGTYEASTDQYGQYVFDNLPLSDYFTLKAKDTNMVILRNQTITDFVENQNLVLYKKRMVKIIVKDQRGNVLPKIEISNPSKNILQTTNNKGEFEAVLYDMPEHHTIYVSDPTHKYQSTNISLANYKDKPIVVTLAEAKAYKTTKTRKQTRSYTLGSGLGINAIEVVAERPIVEQDNPSNARTITAAEIEKLATRNISSIASQKTGTAQRDEGQNLSVASSRIYSEDIYVDGVRQFGVMSIPETVIDNIEINQRPPVEPNADTKLAKDELARDKSINSQRRLADTVVVATRTRYHRARQFYTPEYTKPADENTVRNDFRSTIYWNPTVRTNEKGIAQLEFYNSDGLTQFRVTLEGFARNGGIGRAEYKYFTQRPFQMVAKVPAEVLTGDLVRVPVALSNNTDAPIKGKLNIALPAHLRWAKPPQIDITLAPQASTTVFLDCEVLNQPAEGDFIILFSSDKATDKMITNVKSRPRGFPVRQAFTGHASAQSFDLLLDQPIEGSANLTLNCYPTLLEEIIKGMESMLRMPSGCFEQTSSSNYPNVLVLTYLREANANNPELEAKTKSYLATGYQRLTGYESKSGGFHWWGYDPAHEGLTAYGLMQFVDMQAVYSVDPQLIERTSKWLLSRRNNKGGWNMGNTDHSYWSNSKVLDAYIVWALTEANFGKSIPDEIEATYKTAKEEQDPYQMALLANSLYKLGDSRAATLVADIVKTQAPDGSFTGKTASMTNSRGKALTTETTALAALALLQSKQHLGELDRAIKFLQTSKDYYGYGSTQGTVLTLKAFIAHARHSKQAAEDGTVVVRVGGKEVARTNYKAGQKNIQIPSLAQYLKAGKNNIEVLYQNTKNPLPCELSLAYNTRVPQSSKDCQLHFHTELAANSAKMGETVRITANLRNISNANLTSAMAQIGIPAGLSIQPWQLKEMQERRLFDYYELFDGYVVLHFERLRANELKTINFDLKADIPGSYEAPASVAYLYYSHEHRHWVAPQTIAIN